MPRAAERRPLPPHGIAGTILGATALRLGWPATAAAGALAIALHVAIVVVAAWAPRSSSPRHVVAPPLRVEHEIEPAPAPVQPEPTLPEPAPAPPEPPPMTAPAPAPIPAPVPAPPAAAAPALTAAPADDAVDLSDTELVTGSAARYAGGATARSGTSSQPALTPPARSARTTAPGPAGSAPPSRARPVGLPPGDWSCPWPRAADALSIDHQLVVIRVVVRADGTVARADLVSDPGHGFGQVALACARARRFQPAADAGGRAIEASSPPVHVRFTR
jgi:protein TonB